MIEEVNSVEREFLLERSGFFKRLWGNLKSLFAGSSWAPLIKSRAEEIRLHTGFILIQLALHAYRLEHGAYPQSVTELVPGYLKALPLDPHGGKPLIYRPTPAGYQLYSVGPNRKDDGCHGDDVAAETSG